MSQSCRVKFFKNGRETVVHHYEDVEPTLENNKRLRSDPQKMSWGRHVASIPASIWLRWLNEEWERGNRTITAFGPEMDELVERKLNDPEWSYLRVDK